jgi:alpha-ketoglutarate-dependent taurine dioxygenase
MKNGHDSIYCLSQRQTDILLSRQIPTDLPTNLWPGRDDRIARSPEIASICSDIKGSLRHGAGYSVLRSESGEGDDPHLLKAIYWNLLTSIGKPVPQYSTGELVFEVHETSATPIFNHYSRSNRGGGYHTDGTFLQEIPYYAGLICLRQAKLGGESVLIDSRKIYQELSTHHREALEYLQRDFYFDCCGQLPGVEYRPKPIISRKDSMISVQYLRSYIDEGHAKAGVPLDRSAIESLDLFDSLMGREEFQQVYKLNPGEMLILNNSIMLHGRKPFYDEEGGPSKRLLIRVYATEETCDQALNN